MYPPNNFESYQKQANDLAAKWQQLQQMQNSLATQPVPPLMPPPHIDYVQGLEGAKEYLKNMSANGNTILMDRDEALFYVVSKDANGNPAPIAFAHFELETEQQKPAPEYVTKQDFDQLRNEILTVLKQKGDKG